MSDIATSSGTRSGILPMLASTACFAVMNVFVRFTSRIPPQEQVLFRALVTLLVIGGLYGLRGVSFRGRNRPLLVARGLTGTAALIAYFWTLHRMPLASAVTLQHLSPLFTLFVSAVMLGEPPRLVQIPFFLLAFLGIPILRGFDSEIPMWAFGVGIGSALLSGVSYNLIRALRATDPPEVVVFWFPLVSVPLVGPWALATWVPPTGREWVGLLMVGLLTTGGQLFLSMGYQRSPAREVSALNYLGILYAAVFGLLFFGEPLTGRMLAGVALIVSGVVAGSRLGVIRERPRSDART